MIKPLSGWIAAIGAAFLVACTSDLPPTAQADSASLAAGQSVQLLSNDAVDSVPASAGAGGNVTFSVTSGPLPTGITVNEGRVSIGDGASPGTVALTYRICVVGNSGNCASANASITVQGAAVTAAADTLNLTRGSAGDLLANDRLGEQAATAARVTASAIGALPTGTTLSAAGLLTVGGDAVAGTYNLNYRICATDAPGNCATAAVTLTVPADGMVIGRAVDAATAVGVPGVRVRLGTFEATTDATGAFRLEGAPASGRATVVFSSNTHAQSAVVTELSGATTDVQARLVRVASTTELPIASGGSATVAGSTARVDLPANGVVRSDGTTPSGNVRVLLTPIDPSSDTTVMPGDFTTVANGVETSIESFGAVNVQLLDAGGAPLNLRAGSSATIRIPLASRSVSAPSSIPLFFFNNSTGRWDQEGSATLVGSGAARYYEGTVTHFSTWNADRVMDSVRVRGCVADAQGNRLAGARVFSDGVDYSGTSRAVTDSTGAFSIVVRRSSQATLTALASGTTTNTIRVGPFAADGSVSACLAPGTAGSGITMKLTWGETPDDLDSFLVAPDGTTVDYRSTGSLASAPFASLDVDDTNSFGPEVITITRLMVGTYKYAVNNFSGQSDGRLSTSSARVELNVQGRAAELFVVPSAGETNTTDWWLVLEIDVDSACNITLRRQGTLATSRPTNPGGAPTYCNRP